MSALAEILAEMAAHDLRPNLLVMSRRMMKLVRRARRRWRARGYDPSRKGRFARARMRLAAVMERGEA